jgi:D-arabinose 1-dehydrogenase-like Zn-dependent alcohol dehydrogenase
MDKIPKKSRCAVLYEYNKPLEIREVDILDPEPGAILAKIEAATICGTDVHIWHGKLSQISKLPLIMGHELVGRIVKLGKGINRDAADEPIKIGDRIVWAYPWCGKCYWCTIARQPTLCPNTRMYGWGPCDEPPYLTGGFSEYAYVRPECHIIKVPEEIDSKVAASATCAFRTVIHGFERFRGLGIQDTVLILGSGPVGLYALSMAIVSGAAKTIVVGAPKRRLDLAKKWGADYIINIEETENPEERKDIILGLTEGRGPDVVIECAGPANAFKEGLELVRRGGRYLVIGQTDPNPILIHPTNINIKNIEIVGVLSASVPHYYKAMQFLKNNRNRFSFSDLISNVYKLEDINRALESMSQLKEIKPAIIP